MGRFVSALLVLSLFPIAWFIEPYLSDRVTVCFFRTCTGYPCPFCGLTRALAAALHGHWRLASQLHPLWWLGPLAIWTVAAALLSDVILRTDFLGKWRHLSARFTLRWVVIVMAGACLLRILGDRF